MKSKAVVRVILSALAALGINAIPAGIVLAGGESIETAMVLYFFENIVSILLAAARVRVLAPADDKAYSGLAPDFTEIKMNGRTLFRGRTPRTRRTLLRQYLISSLGLSAATGVFLFFFLFLILRAEISGSVVIEGLTGMVAFQLFNFVIDLFLLGPLPVSRAEALLQQSFGRVALLHLAVFVGVFLALIVEQWFIVPFAILKTLADLTRPIQAVSQQESLKVAGEGE